MDFCVIFILFLIIAFVYSSVGFGGGSSYLAVLAMHGLPFQEIRLVALICNIIVVFGGVHVYLKNKQVHWQKILPITLVSIPMAFLGAVLKISQQTFFMLLGMTLIAAAVLLWIKTETENIATASNKSGTSIFSNGFIGGTIGFLSGMVGIGGGIFLSPLLNLLKWDTPRKIAATASVFILANSISGIIGQLSKLPTEIDFIRISSLCLAVLIGGQIGSRMSLKWNLPVIKRMTAVLVLLAGINILLKH